MDNDFNSDFFKNILKEKEEQILMKAQNKLLENDNYRIIHRGLISFHKQNAINEFLVILIEKSEIENFEFITNFTFTL